VFFLFLSVSDFSFTSHLSSLSFSHLSPLPSSFPTLSPFPVPFSLHSILFSSLSRTLSSLLSSPLPSLFSLSHTHPLSPPLPLRVNTLSWDAEGSVLYLGGSFYAVESNEITPGLAMWTEQSGAEQCSAVNDVFCC
jgi:hypothetical protein